MTTSRAATAPPGRPLPVTRAADLDPHPPEQRWLIEDLWADEAVGIVGGEPKCCKSFLALEIAVAVASGAPCLRRFPVARTGRVLLFAAEDALYALHRPHLERSLTGIEDAKLPNHGRGAKPAGHDRPPAAGRAAPGPRGRGPMPPRDEGRPRDDASAGKLRRRGARSGRDRPDVHQFSLGESYEAIRSARPVA